MQSSTNDLYKDDLKDIDTAKLRSKNASVASISIKSFTSKQVSLNDEKPGVYEIISYAPGEIAASPSMGTLDRDEPEILLNIETHKVLRKDASTGSL